MLRVSYRLRYKRTSTPHNARANAPEDSGIEDQLPPPCVFLGGGVAGEGVGRLLAGDDEAGHFVVETADFAVFEAAICRIAPPPS